MFENSTEGTIEYATANTGSGYFFVDQSKVFPLKPGGKCGIVATKVSDTACGATGYVSVKLRLKGRDYIIGCGFYVPYDYSRYNYCGAEIRSHVEKSDSVGAAKGHAMTPTGVVPDIDAFMTVFHGAKQTDLWKHQEFTEYFDLDVQFSGSSHAIYYFEFKGK